MCLIRSRITFYGPLNKIMTQEEMELKSRFVTSQLIGLPATQKVAISCSHLWYLNGRTVFRFELMKSVGKQWCLCYNEVKEMRSMDCGDDDLRDFLLLVYWCIPLLSPTAMCQSKGCHVVVATTFLCNGMTRRSQGKVGKHSGQGSLTARGRC
jgi:hypothetical protein